MIFVASRTVPRSTTLRTLAAQLGGAASRPCAPDETFEEWPFGIAEWVAFSQTDRHASAGAAQDRLILHFEEDLQLTLNAGR